MTSPLPAVPFPPKAAVQGGRIRVLKDVEKRTSSSPIPTSRPVVYWMFRDQRCRDNWALIHAVDLANRTNSPVAVVFNLFHRFLGAHSRQLGFMLRGLRQLHSSLVSLGIPFFFLRGDVVENVPRFVKEYRVGTLVTDFTPLREVRKWKEEICGCLDNDVVVQEVDAHNLVPLWAASGKLEYSARTIRSKINKLLPEYLIEFPELSVPRMKWMEGDGLAEIHWDQLIEDVLREGNNVPEIDWCKPGEEAGMEMLRGSKEGFLTKRLRGYSNDRNDPTKPKGLSCLSPYLHFGQISAQRCALEAQRFKKTHSHSVEAFLEELIIRRELADNYCFYQPHYDSLQGAWEWAFKTLMAHASDKRDHIYSKEELEGAKTVDPLWNASQLEMIHHGKMHGFMSPRKVYSASFSHVNKLVKSIHAWMYWAKKILEWTSGPEEALSIAIYLNDKYEIDGRDPSGYVGCMWSICGVHDQGWRERPVFGKIRYMNYAGCKRKFDVDGYIAYVRKLVGDTKKRKLQSTDNRGLKELKTDT